METLIGPRLEYRDASAPEMWQLWRPFTGMRHWFFSYGCPPPLRNLDVWTGWVHATALFGAIGALASFIILLVAGTLELVHSPHFLEVAIVLGLIQGLLVIYPLALWTERTMFWSSVGILVCIASYSLTSGWSLELNKLLTQWLGAGIQTRSVWFMYALILHGAPSAIFVVFLLGLQPRTVWVLLVTFLMTLILASCHAFEGELDKLSPSIVRKHPIGALLIGALPVLWYWTFLAVVLGWGLWPLMRLCKTSAGTNDRPSESS